MAVDNITQGNFLISEYQEIHKYFVNVEKSMLDLLRFYNSVFTLLVPISGLLFKLLDKKQVFAFLAALAFVISILGLYILAMYIELRVRKIKTLEQIAVFRERFIERNPSIFSKYLKMITSIKSCPPYLRRPSSEWYTVIYISFLNGGAIASIVACILLWINTFVCLNWLGMLKLPLLIALPVLFWLFIGMELFLFSTRYCYIYDLKREREYNVKNDYSFLDPRPYFPRIFKMLKWIAERHERKIRSRYGHKEE